MNVLAEMSEPDPDPDPDGVDVSLIRWFLTLSLEDRLEHLQGFVDSVAELRGGGAS